MNPNKDTKEADPEVPNEIVDSTTGTSYIKGRFYGKGGFAKCYEITDPKTRQVFAGKIVSKKLLIKNNQKEKMTQEIEIHRSLTHKHVVQFRGFFDDPNFVYIVLELCRKRSMMELHRRRKALTEPEVRYYMHQILSGVLYLHKNGIIHRDLKLGNLFLNDDVEVKIGDFGLAARIEYTGQRKKTLCGTPNYIAPEILNKKGHSFEVDVWSIGCIMYTLLVGKPPFETNSLRETYSRIKRCEYKIPSQLRRSKQAVAMINQMLQSEPALRPTVKELLHHPFFTSGYMPPSLPVSSLTMAPRFDVIQASEVAFPRRPLIEINGGDQSPGREQILPLTPSKQRDGGPSARKSPYGHSPQPGSSKVQRQLHSGGNHGGRNIQVQRLQQLEAVAKLLEKLNLAELKVVPDNPALLEEMSDPAAQPMFWISKWVDYSDKYGFGYQLCDDSLGVMFNDYTKIVLLQDQQNVHYFEKNGVESYYTMNNTPALLEKKKKLLLYFLRYMTDHLMKTGGSIQRDSDQLSRIPYISFWHRSANCVLMQMTNGTFQLNFMDHNKLIICPLMEAVTHVDEEKNFRTYRFESIAKRGCSETLKKCLDYSRVKIQTLKNMEMRKVDC